MDRRLRIKRRLPSRRRSREAAAKASPSTATPFGEVKTPSKTEQIKVTNAATSWSSNAKSVRQL